MKSTFEFRRLNSAVTYPYVSPVGIVNVMSRSETLFGFSAHASSSAPSVLVQFPDRCVFAQPSGALTLNRVGKIRSGQEKYSANMSWLGGGVSVGGGGGKAVASVTFPTPIFGTYTAPGCCAASSARAWVVALLCRSSSCPLNRGACRGRKLGARNVDDVWCPSSCTNASTQPTRTKRILARPAGSYPCISDRAPESLEP